jgi:hypothetical protein
MHNYENQFFHTPVKGIGSIQFADPLFIGFVLDEVLIDVDISPEDEAWLEFDNVLVVH